MFIFQYLYLKLIQTKNLIRSSCSESYPLLLMLLVFKHWSYAPQRRMDVNLICHHRSFLVPEQLRGEDIPGMTRRSLMRFLLHGCAHCQVALPSTMLSMSANTGPLEGASGMCMVYSPIFSLRGFSFSTGWYSSKSSRVIMPPGT